MQLIKGEPVEVLRPAEGAPDEMGEPALAWGRERVENVLPSPGGTADLDATRPDGVRVDVTFHFPKGYAADLRGCRVAWGGRTYRVVGDPVRYAEANTPGPWDLAAEAVSVDG